MGVRSNSMMEPEMVSEDSGFFVASDSEELQDPVMSQQQKPVAPVDRVTAPVQRGRSRVPRTNPQDNLKNAMPCFRGEFKTCGAF